jgi:hypothetical protein
MEVWARSLAVKPDSVREPSSFITALDLSDRFLPARFLVSLEAQLGPDGQRNADCTSTTKSQSRTMLPPSVWRSRSRGPSMVACCSLACPRLGSSSCCSSSLPHSSKAFQRTFCPGWSSPCWLCHFRFSSGETFTSCMQARPTCVARSPWTQMMRGCSSEARLFLRR